MEGSVPGGSESTLSEVALEAWRNLVRSHSRLLRMLDQDLQKEHGFTIGDYDVLLNLALASGGKRRMCDLADAIILSPSGLTRRVDRLESMGLVRRRRSDEDARNVVAALTAEGKRVVRRLGISHLNEIDRVFASRFTPAELETLAELLGRLRTD